MMFYERLVPLNRDAHLALLLKQSGFPFAAQINSAPLLGAEMPEAARSFPIAFVPIGQEQIFPVAFLGLRTSENLFIDAEGGWEPGRYVPAFIRRYPFVLADDMTVLIDEAYPGLGTEEGEPLFTADGANSPVLENALAFLRGFQDEVVRTQAFVNTLQELDLFKEASLTVETAGDVPFRIDGILLIDTDRLAALSDEAALRLFRSGELAWIHAHVHSIGGLNELNRRRAAHQAREVSETAIEVFAMPESASTQSTDETAEDHRS